ncbi:hypothetical protein HHL11_18275 [Ramlibacter sp. G-1-2-2]|uniref:Cytochrome c-type biogenesis protein H TPR domain-containing protein n=1 Tax=Ramlibacter agri TaxID=2728837 RepID=A0A848H8A3_9BURK|nr:hypothetical protein [Ramlibacter agri]NML45701.1 hypothetical protein [Ramlibacter agri]
MTAFWVIAAVLVAGVLAGLLRPLLRGAGATPPAPALAGALIAVVPSCAIMMYLHLGNPIALWSGEDLAHGHGTPSTAQVEGMVNQLAQRLRAEPDDPEGWAMLARSYSALERHGDAAAAYARAVELLPREAALRADFADELASAEGGTLQGAAREQILAALALDPAQPKALALAASAALERGDRSEAIASWERLLQVLPPDSRTAAQVQANLARARAAPAR